MKTLKSIVGKLYPNSAEQLISELEPLLDFGKDVPKGPSDWYKYISMYVCYPFSFKNSNGEANFDTLTNELGRIKELGCNAIHVLPFLESPKIDNGFDISDYYRVREEFGGMEAFDRFLRASKDNGFKVFIDVVFNHVSIEHQWFQKALKGEKKYADFFYASNRMPPFIKKYKQRDGDVADYEYVKGKTTTSPIIFPEQAGEIPHWAKYGNNWYYHTFYPQQIDLNYSNPEVFLEMAKVLIFWAKKGVNFRLDAIVFVGKDFENGDLIDTEMSKLLVAAFRQIVRLVDTDTVFLLEAALDDDQLIEYFEEQKTPRKADLAYDFKGMNILWETILSKNTDRIKNYIENRFTLGNGKRIGFLRNHDELTLEFSTDELRNRLLSELLPKGEAFRGNHGIAGRTASFLDEQEDRIVTAYALLASLPDTPAIIYGDEYGKTNDERYKHQEYTIKAKHLSSKNIKPDARDINRGYITQEERSNTYANSIHSEISKIFTARFKLPYFLESELTIASLNGGLVLLTEYNESDERLRCYTQIGEGQFEIDLPANCTIFLKIGDVKIEDTKAILKNRAALWFT